MMVEIRNNSGLVATEKIPAGVIILLVTEGTKCDRDRHSIEYDGVSYMHSLGKFVNHSCDPNCIMIWSALTTTKTIGVGEEITFNYLDNESVITSPFECSCGSDWCAGRIE